MGSTKDNESPLARLRSAPRTPPSNRSRSAQMQLFLLVAALMGVLVAMNEARKPENWAWMWGGAPPAAEDAVDTRVPPDRAADPPQEATTDQESGDLSQQLLKGNLAPGPTPDHVRLAWQRLYRDLDRDQKRDLSQLLRAGRLGRAPAAEDTTAWQQLIEHLDRHWSNLIADQRKAAETAESELLPRQRERLSQAAQALEDRWQQQDRPALAAVADQTPLTELQQQNLSEIQAILDESDLAAIRDDTVWRPAEREAWFRLLEQLQRSDPQTLAQRSLGDVGFVQIFRQPDEYRGKIVTVRGTAKLGYRVPAPPNDLGITGYYLFWLRPADGTNVPIVVYALETPPGLPDLTTEEHTPLQHHLEVTGYFFKRWVYRAHDGLNTVPLLVTNRPRWIPSPAPEKGEWEELTEQAGEWTWAVLGGIALVLAGMAAGIAWLVNRSSRARLSKTLVAEGERGVDWEKLPDAPSVAESLRQLEQHDREQDSSH